MNKILVLVLLCNAQLLVATEYYENPFLYQLKEEDEGNVVYRKDIEYADGNTSKQEIQTQTKLYSSLDIGPSAFNHKSLFTVITENEKSIFYHGDVVNGVLRSTLSHHGYWTPFGEGFGLSRYPVGGSVPTNNKIEKGQQYEMWYRSHLNLKFNDSNKSTQVILKEEKKFRFAGLEEIQTPWGMRVASVIEGNSTVNYSLYDYDTEDVWPKATGALFTAPLDSKWKSYYIKNLGLYREDYESNSTHPRFRSQTSVTLFESTNIDFTPEDFSPITNAESTSSVSLDAWTWNGAFPWVYNANTDSWFYYRFNGNACYAYDVRSSKWFAFDEGNGGWRLAQ